MKQGEALERLGAHGRVVRESLFCLISASGGGIARSGGWMRDATKYELEARCQVKNPTRLSIVETWSG